MEIKEIDDFTKFLESNVYCSSTIRIYIRYAGQFLETLTCQTQAELEKQINLIDDKKQQQVVAFDAPFPESRLKPVLPYENWNSNQGLQGVLQKQRTVSAPLG